MPDGIFASIAPASGDVWTSLPGSRRRYRAGSVMWITPPGWWNVRRASGVDVGGRRDNGRPWTPVMTQARGAVLLLADVYPDTPVEWFRWSAFRQIAPEVAG